MEPLATPDTLPYQRAYDAHRHTSHVPEVRAKNEQESFAACLNAFQEQVLNLCTTPCMFEKAAQELVRYRDGYLQRKLAYCDARSRCLSSMIVGPARFPVARAEKANRSADKRRDELLEWDARARAAVLRHVKAASPEGLAKAAEEEAARAAAPPPSDFMTGEGWRAIENHAENRLQILFDAKPSPERIAKLKKSGWRWSPRFGAWQRQLTQNARYSVEYVMKD
jgi:hypothetical protein